MRALRRAILLVLLVVSIAAGFAGAIFYLRVNRPYKGYGASEQFVEIAPRSRMRAIERSLVDSGVVRDPMTFRIALWMTGSARRLRAGEYRFDRPMTPLEVVTKIAHGEVYERPLTFPEGLTIREMSQIFETRGFGAATVFVAAASDTSLVAAFDPEARDLEGYLFPETYLLPRRTPVDRLIRLMVGRFGEVFGDDLRRGAQARGLTVRQAVTLASLVEKETARPEERPLVAAVYLNRLKIGMGLQCDPTVIYALERAGKYDGNLTRDDLAFDSPYNTYKYAGLPPGPIASPGKTSLEAAARPADVDYLYFVSRNDGSHVFARTLDEHNRNVREFQVKFFREKRNPM